MTPEQRLIDNIDTIAHRRRITRKAMAEHLKVQEQTIYRRMAGETTWPTRDLVILANLLDVDMSVLWAEAIGFSGQEIRALTNWYVTDPTDEAVA